jgi:hypothetical protein
MPGSHNRNPVQQLENGDRGREEKKIQEIEGVPTEVEGSNQPWFLEYR